MSPFLSVSFSPSVVSSAWHGFARAATSSPWCVVALLVPAVAVLVACTRLTVRRG